MDDIGIEDASDETESEKGWIVKEGWKKSLDRKDFFRLDGFVLLVPNVVCWESRGPCSLSLIDIAYAFP